MKKDLKRLFCLIFVLFVISFSIILFYGKTYDVKFNVSDKNDYVLNIEKDSGDIEILKKEMVGNNYVIKVKAKKPGKVFLSLNNNSSNLNTLLYIHKSLVITDNNYFGYSTGSEIIPISLLIVLGYLLYLLVVKYKTFIKENLFQYKNVAYLGIIMFMLPLFFNILLSVFNYHGLFDTINRFLSSVSLISFFLLPIAFITFVLVTISNIRLIQMEGRSLRNLLGLILGILICVLTLLPDFVYKLLLKSQIINIFNLNSPGPYIYNFIETFVYLIVAYLECVLIATIIIALKSVRRKIQYNKDYMIILGCQINKDGSLPPLLRGRVDKAISFRNDQLKETGKDLVFIPSGGKGSDEVMSEADAMKKYLLGKGIDKKRIILENKSTNTYENIKFSNKLIKKNNAKVAFSTTNYHVFRAGLLATEQGLLYEGIGSKTKSYFWINAFIREFIGTLYSEKKKHFAVFGLILIIILIMIIILFWANNI